ncbi:MAG TPA: tetratricopeptide repeat protein, partial [Chthoniobacterales bacterium]|nr:tetratricopeptide repeat protein [Chthoniobacterales bacterium]
MRRVLVYLLCAAALPLPAQETAVERAAQPLRDGIPNVAVVRLRALLASALGAEDRRDALIHLGEALIAAARAEEALQVLADPALRELPPAKFHIAQALAALERWAEALPLYQQVAADAASPFRSEASFAVAEALRALGRNDEALRAYSALEHDPRWFVRAAFRRTELLLARNDAAAAARILNAIDAKSPADRRERRFLRGCLELKLGNRPAAIQAFASILKNQQGAPRPVLIATLIGIADAHLQSNRPRPGGKFLEEFIERHPTDPDLPPIFAKLDQLYAAERKQSRHDLEPWSRDTAQPRRALAQWYLARAELRMNNRDRALQVFDRLRAERAPVSVLPLALLEY